MLSRRSLVRYVRASWKLRAHTLYVVRGRTEEAALYAYTTLGQYVEDREANTNGCCQWHVSLPVSYTNGSRHNISKKPWQHVAGKMAENLSNKILLKPLASSLTNYNYPFSPSKWIYTILAKKILETTTNL